MTDRGSSRPLPRRSTTWWGIAAALVVVAGLAAAAITGGPGAGDDSSGSQLTILNNAPAPKKGDRVIAAGETDVRDAHYRIVMTVPRLSDAKRASVPLYANEYLGKPGRLLQRLRMPWPWSRDSSIVDFKVESTPGSNPDNAAGLALSWFLHGGDQAPLTRYFQVSSHGIELD
jgi:hypothetical protein